MVEPSMEGEGWSMLEDHLSRTKRSMMSLLCDVNNEHSVDGHSCSAGIRPAWMTAEDVCGMKHHVLARYVPMPKLA